MCRYLNWRWFLILETVALNLSILEVMYASLPYFLNHLLAAIVVIRDYYSRYNKLFDFDSIFPLQMILNVERYSR